MAQFLITYDAHKERHYTRLYQLLAGWKAVRLADSVWLANLVGPASVIRGIVAGTLDNDDTVAVLRLHQGADWATLRASAAASAWLSDYVTPAQAAA
jgi:hypothetical protein